MEATAQIHIEGMSSKSCISKIQDHLTKEPGVINVKVCIETLFIYLLIKL